MLSVVLTFRLKSDAFFFFFCHIRRRFKDKLVKCSGTLVMEVL